ncbi:hypothetical protein BJ912DRAFT_929900 [Pholiota molesta]|nr:hypothetical protein BJ912DRAFT_929900 [Pholiota molesta]
MSSSPLLVIDPLDAPEAGVAFHAYSAPARAILIAFFHMRVDFFLSRNDLESFVASEPVEALAFIRLTLQHMNSFNFAISQLCGSPFLARYIREAISIEDQIIRILLDNPALQSTQSLVRSLAAVRLNALSNLARRPMFDHLTSMQFSEQHINTYRDLSVVLLRAGYAESQVAAYVASHPNPTSAAVRELYAIQALERPNAGVWFANQTNTDRKLFIDRLYDRLSAFTYAKAQEHLATDPIVGLAEIQDIALSLVNANLTSFQIWRTQDVRMIFEHTLYLEEVFLSLWLSRSDVPPPSSQSSGSATQALIEQLSFATLVLNNYKIVALERGDDYKELGPLRPPLARFIELEAEDDDYD